MLQREGQQPGNSCLKTLHGAAQHETTAAGRSLLRGLQLQAQGLGGPLNFLTPDEGKMADETIMTQIDRPWQLWRKKALGR